MGSSTVAAPSRSRAGQMPRPPGKAALRAARLDPAVRERLILDGAIRYFSENGWTGTTAGLARDLGIAQALLYRYFPTKDDLIQRIYEEIERRLFDPAWTALIEDRSRPLRDRLVAFYRGYVARVMTRDRFRLFLHESLATERGHASRYYGLVQRRVFAAIARALRREAGLPAGTRPRARDLELAQGLHGMFQSLALRRWVYRSAVPRDIDGLIERNVALFLHGVFPLLAGTARRGGAAAAAGGRR